MEQGTFTPPRTAAEREDSSGAQATAGKLADQAQQKAQEATSQARDRVREQVSERSTQAGERVTSTASDIRSVAEELRKQGKDEPAKLAEQAADRAEQVGGYLKSSDADRLLHDLEDLGRRKPWALAVGGVVAGLAASRFLKASSSERYRVSQFQGAGDGPDRANGVQSVTRLPDAAPTPALSGRG